MIDINSHFAVLDVLRAQLELANNSGKLKDKRADRAVAALKDEYPFAILGSIIDHLLAHDGPSDVEVGLLFQARGLWNELCGFISDFRQARLLIEQVAQNPNDSHALDNFNAARQVLADLIPRYDLLVAKAQSYRWQLQPQTFLTPHPQEEDRPVKDWPWRDVVLSRRSGAFAANMMEVARADGSPAALAFGLGVVASYVGNAVGSPYLVHGVGGPRRSHPYRDRVASYSVGAWFSAVPLPVQPNFDRARSVPHMGSPLGPSLPPWLVDMILKALDGTYQGKGPGSLPDLNAAYQQLEQHWELLHSFSPIPKAQPINAQVRGMIVNTLQPQDYDRPDPGQGIGPQNSGPAPSGGGNIFDPGPGAPPWFNPNIQNVWDGIKEGCLDIIFLPLFLIRLGFYLGHKGSKPKPTNTGQSRAALSDPVTPAEYSAIMGSKDILIAIDELFYMDLALDTLSRDCLRIMKHIGLLYPESNDLVEFEYRQFLVLPPASLAFTWPTRPIANPDAFLSLPDSPVENPSLAPSGFAPGEKPIAFLTRGIGTAPAADNVGLDLLEKEIVESPNSPIRVANLNLDGDRGLDQDCWALVDGKSVKDDPIPFTVLNYNAV